MSDDTISRKATIDAMEGVDWYHINKDGQLVHGANSKEGEPLYKAEDVYKVLNTMPSAQPKKRTEKRTETHGVCLDAIDRQAAIDVLDRNHILGQGLLNDTLDHIADAIMALSSAQPQRTGRWKKVNGKINCSACNHCSWSRSFEDTVKGFNFCPNCGADMRTPVEVARDIVHEAINNSVWSDTVDTAKMRKVVDDKYAEIRGDANADVES